MVGMKLSYYDLPTGNHIEPIIGYYWCQREGN